MREVGPLRTLCRGGARLLLIVPVKGESHHTNTHSSPPVTVSSTSPDNLASFSEVSHPNSCKGWPSFVREIRQLLQGLRDWWSGDLWNNLHLGCDLSLPLPFLLLNENRTIEHHLFFRFFSFYLFISCQGKGQILWGLLATVLEVPACHPQMLTPHSHVRALSLGKSLLCADGADRPASYWPRTVLLLREPFSEQTTAHVRENTEWPQSSPVAPGWVPASLLLEQRARGNVPGQTAHLFPGAHTEGSRGNEPGH